MVAVPSRAVHPRWADLACQDAFFAAKEKYYLLQRLPDCYRRKSTYISSYEESWLIYALSSRMNDQAHTAE